MSIDQQIESLLATEQWETARALLKQELIKAPTDHWLITQLGVINYEQRKYRSARQQFLRSLKIVGDCPLTLWNLAGALDALGDVERAILIYSSLLRSRKTASDDPCWESQEWSDSLKADCVYRLGVCLQRLGKLKESEEFYRTYLNLLLAGVAGTYSADEVAREIRFTHASQAKIDPASDARKVFRSAVRGLPAKDDLLDLTRDLQPSNGTTKQRRLPARSTRKPVQKKPAPSKRAS